ncbi:MAG: hypothetical protein IPP88_03670 [Betaproteobacteria bacterium]|nr:hypothetical protein [Betaproteobacteria bacterium]
MLMFTLFGFAAAAVQAIYPLILGLCVVWVFYCWCQHRAKLMVVSDVDEKAGNRSALRLFLISVFPSFFS